MKKINEIFAYIFMMGATSCLIAMAIGMMLVY